MKKLALIVLLAAAALPAAQTRNQATTVVDPSLYQQVYYRPLSPVWSRGGRVTAVTGVEASLREPEQRPRTPGSISKFAGDTECLPSTAACARKVALRPAKSRQAIERGNQRG